MDQKTWDEMPEALRAVLIEAGIADGLLTPVEEVPITKNRWGNEVYGDPVQSMFGMYELKLYSSSTPGAICCWLSWDLDGEGDSTLLNLEQMKQLRARLDVAIQRGESRK